jgi:hypothetical protein
MLDELLLRVCLVAEPRDLLYKCFARCALLFTDYF